MTSLHRASMVGGRPARSALRACQTEIATSRATIMSGASSNRSPDRSALSGSGSCVCLSQHPDDLLVRKPASTHAVLLLSPGRTNYQWTGFRGAGQDHEGVRESDLIARAIEVAFGRVIESSSVDSYVSRGRPKISDEKCPLHAWAKLPDTVKRALQEVCRTYKERRIE